MKSHVLKQMLCAAVAVTATSLPIVTFVYAKPQEDSSRAALTNERESNQVARGRYVVKTTGCNDCHTPGYSLAAGKLGESQWLTGSALGFQGPWGTTYPVNLRLYVQGVTQEQWLQLARQPARPPMPWFALRDMTDEDLAAMYQYIRSLGAAGAHAPSYVPPGQSVETPVVKFPVN